MFQPQRPRYTGGIAVNHAQTLGGLAGNEPALSPILPTGEIRTPWGQICTDERPAGPHAFSKGPHWYFCHWREKQGAVTHNTLEGVLVKHSNRGK